MNKDSNSNSICTKNNVGAIVPVPAAVVANMLGVGVTTVREVRRNCYPCDTTKAQLIRVVDEMLEDGINSVVAQVAGIINPASVNAAELTIKLYKRVDMENPIYEVRSGGERVCFVQRIETNSYAEWHRVRFDNKIWCVDGANSFLGYSKKEVIYYLSK